MSENYTNNRFTDWELLGYIALVGGLGYLFGRKTQDERNERGL